MNILYLIPKIHFLDLYAAESLKHTLCRPIFVEICTVFTYQQFQLLLTRFMQDFVSVRSSELNISGYLRGDRIGVS